MRSSQALFRKVTMAQARSSFGTKATSNRKAISPQKNNSPRVSSNLNSKAKSCAERLFWFTWDATAESPAKRAAGCSSREKINGQTRSGRRRLLESFDRYSQAAHWRKLEAHADPERKPLETP